MSSKPNIAIIGAGLSGLTLAHMLKAHAHVHVFEKSRGYGGRMATRRAEGYEFDHGAQFFTIRDPSFRDFLAPLFDAGSVQQWTPRLTGIGTADPVWDVPHYVAVPGMSALGRALAADLRIRRECRVGALSRRGDLWQLKDTVGQVLGDFDWVVSTAPAEQARALLPAAFGTQPALEGARLKGCYSLMVGLDSGIDFGWDAAQVEGGPVSWIACNHSKPGRSDAPAIVCHSGNDWAEDHMEDDPKAVQDLMLEQLFALTGLTRAACRYVNVHRWRYARMSTPAGAPFLLDQKNQLAAIGDWCGAGRVESAFQSAKKLSENIIRT